MITTISTICLYSFLISIYFLSAIALGKCIHFQKLD